MTGPDVLDRLLAELDRHGDGETVADVMIREHCRQVLVDAILGRAVAPGALGLLRAGRFADAVAALDVAVRRAERVQPGPGGDYEGGTPGPFA